MKKVLVIQGNTMEIGQTLTNLFGSNPKLKVIHSFTSTGIRPVQQSGIVTPGQQSYEPVTVIFMVYENPGELAGILTSPAPVKASLSKTN